MSKYGVLAMGPAGAGKSTFCSALIEHLQNNRRSYFYVNLDPAAEDFTHEPDLDIKELISLDDVMEEMGLGPNGGLIYCFEFLLENLDFFDPMESINEEYLIIIDMPGQIELYTHNPIVPALVNHLNRNGQLQINLCAAYLLESTFIVDRPKFFAGTLSAMSAMIMLEIPHINILSKMDLIRGMVGRRELRKFLDPDEDLVLEEDKLDPVAEDNCTDPRDRDALMSGESFKKLNQAVAELIDDFSMVSFVQLDVQDEHSLGSVLSHIDYAIQYHEAQEPIEPNDELVETPWEDTDMD